MPKTYPRNIRGLIDYLREHPHVRHTAGFDGVIEDRQFLRFERGTFWFERPNGTAFHQLAGINFQEAGIQFEELGFVISKGAVSNYYAYED